MNKLEFINTLAEKLSVLSHEDVKGILDFYVEFIDDHMEDGMTEDEAIAALGSLEDLSEKIISEHTPIQPPQAPEPPAFSPVPDQTPPDPGEKPRRFTPGIIALLVIGSPIWLSLGLAAVAVLLSVYIVIWAILVSLAVTAVALILSGLVGIPAAFLFPITPATTAVLLGCCMIAAAVGFLLLPLCLYCIKGFVHFHRYLVRHFHHKKEVSL